MMSLEEESWESALPGSVYAYLFAGGFVLIWCVITFSGGYQVQIDQV